MSQVSKAASTQSTTMATSSTSSAGNPSIATHGKPVAAANFLSDVSLALRVTETLQDYVHGVLREFTEWSTDAPETGIAGVKLSIKNIHAAQSKLEKIVSEYPRLPDAQPVPLGNTGLVGLDPGEDRTTFYKQLLDAGSWARSVSKEAGEISRELKRRHKESRNNSQLKMAKDDRIKEYKGFYQHLDIMKKEHPDLIIDFDPKRHFYFNVGIKDILNASIVLSGVTPHRVIVRGYREEVKDVWTQSSFVVFRKLTDVFQAALLHFFHCTNVIEGTKEYLKWISSYKTLFIAKCAECNRHLQMTGTEKVTFLPPCWRNFTSYKAIHLECR